MMNDRKKWLIFLLILISFVSISGVSATAMDNVTSIDEGIGLDEALLVDDSFDNQLSHDLNYSNSIQNNNVNVISRNLSSVNLDLDEGSYEFVNCNMSDVNLTIRNAVVNITNSNFNNGNIFINGGIVKINNNIFTASTITQTSGDLDLTSNIITKSAVGVNVTGGITNLAFNSLYDNYISLIYNSADILYDNNWWGGNKPTYNYSSDILKCDVLQTGGVKSSFNSWLVLSVSQSSNLDYDYWIAGITYYNLTINLNYNNLGQDTTNRGHVKDFDLTLTYLKNYHYQDMKGVNKVFTETASQNCSVSDGRGECIFTLGYLTSDLSELNITILDEKYSVNLSNNIDNPSITYVTPSGTFDDSLAVEIECNGTDAVIFYTLDGTNPAYSTTRLVYTHPIMLNESSTLHYTVIDKWGNFQKVLVDNIFNYGAHTFIKQDSYVELVPNHQLVSSGVYYSLDGTTRELNVDTDSYLYYAHPFIIQNPSEIYFFYYGKVIPNIFATDYTYPISINTYALDFSTNYIKDSTFAKNEAIWSQYQGNINNTGVTVYDGPLFNQSSWSNEDIASFGSAVINNEGHIFVGGSDGYLYCLNSQGLVIWRYGTTSKIICTPTIGPDGNIYLSNWMDSMAYCISPQGKLIWKYHLGDYNTGTSPVFGLDNRLYIITSNSIYSTMHVFKYGKLIANHTIPFISGSTPVACEDGRLYMVSAEHELVILNFDGSLRNATFIDTGYFNYAISNNQNTQISVSLGPDGTLYVINYQRSHHKETFSTVYDDKPATGTINYHCVVNAYCLDGTLKWTMTRNVTELLSEFKEYVSGTPSYYKGVLYITGNDNLIAVNASNGEFLWMRAIAHSDSTASSPLISGNEIIYVTSANIVYAFSLNGDLIWQYEIKGSPVSYSSPVLDNNGTLIVTTNQGIYAFNDIAADFTYSHVDGTETTIQFTDLSTKGSNRYYWTFGDGSVSRQQNPIHAYESEGKYRVVLLVEINGTITVARNTTIEVVFHDITPPSNVSAYINDNLTDGGVFNETQYVTLNATDEMGNVTIFYTVDGSNPVTSKTRKVYVNPIEIEIYTVLNVVAIDSSNNYGMLSSLTFNITDVIDVNSRRINEIQELLDNAEDGSKVLFDYSDLKNANFTVNKPLNIISNSSTKLYGRDNQPIFTFTSDAKGSILNGFDVYNTDGDGVLIYNTSDIVIKNCVIDTYKHNGISIQNSDNVSVIDTKVVHALNGVIVNQSSNSNLDSLTVSRSFDNGVWIVESVNTTLSNSLLEVNGRYQYSSAANQVLVVDSNYTTIKGNTINYGFFAICLYNTNFGVVIDNNIIYEGSADAIVLSNNYSFVNITHNLIDGCSNGINFMGNGQNIVIRQNVIQNLHSHSDDLYNTFKNKTDRVSMASFVYKANIPEDKLSSGYNGIELSYPSSNFDEGNVRIYDNVIIKLSSFAWADSAYQYTLNATNSNYIYNLMDGFANYNVSYDSIRYGQTKTENTVDTSRYTPGLIDLVIDRIGDSVYRLRLLNILDNHFLFEIPSFDVTFRSGGSSKTVKFKNDSAIAVFDSIAAVSNIEVIISAGIKKVAHFDMDITEGYASSNRNYDTGFEKGEAYDNPNPQVPLIPDEEMDSDSEDEDSNPDSQDENNNHLSQNNVNGSAAGNASFGISGKGKNTIFGKANGFAGKITQITGIGDISSITTSFDASESSGASGFNGEASKAYEVSKVIDSQENPLKFIITFIILSCMVLGFSYRRLGDDLDEY